MVSEMVMHIESAESDLSFSLGLEECFHILRCVCVDYFSINGADLALGFGSLAEYTHFVWLLPIVKLCPDDICFAFDLHYFQVHTASYQFIDKPGIVALVDKNL